MSANINSPLKVLVLTEQRLIAEMVKLTLDRGMYVTRSVRDAEGAFELLEEWQPQLAIVDMDNGGDQVVRRITNGGHVGGNRIPVLALTRRGDLKTKLAANAGQIATRDEIMDALWGVDFVSGSNVVERHIRSLRVQLQNDWRKPRFIATVPGQGYRFVAVFSGRATA